MRSGLILPTVARTMTSGETVDAMLGNGNQARISWFPLRLPLEAAKKALPRAAGQFSKSLFRSLESGRWDSNPRRPAWEAARNNGCVALRAKKQRYTSSLLQYALRFWRVFKPQR
jgi:hypothetical protein